LPTVPRWITTFTHSGHDRGQQWGKINSPGSSA
jgi:hypothetical protein